MSDERTAPYPLDADATLVEERAAKATWPPGLAWLDAPTLGLPQAPTDAVPWRQHAVAAAREADAQRAAWRAGLAAARPDAPRPVAEAGGERIAAASPPKGRDAGGAAGRARVRSSAAVPSTARRRLVPPDPATQGLLALAVVGFALVAGLSTFLGMLALAVAFGLLPPVAAGFFGVGGLFLAFGAVCLAAVGHAGGAGTR